MSTTDINALAAGLSDDQLALIVAEARKRKMAKVKSEKFAHLEPHYSEYRKVLSEVKTVTDRRKALLAKLKELGFGKKETTKPNGTTPTPKKKK